MVSFDNFSVTLADYTPGLSDFRTSIDGHPTGFYGTVDILRMKKLKFSGFFFFFEKVIGTSF